MPRRLRSRDMPVPDGDGALARERFHDISRLVSDWIWETDANFDITYVSDRVVEVLDMHPREIVGLNLFDLGTFRPAVGNAPGGAGGRGGPSRETRSPFRNLPFLVALADGRLKYCHLSGLPIFDADGAFRGFRGTATDITAETEARRSATLSRERLTTAVENISEGFALYDAADHLVLCNGRFREIFAEIGRILFPGTPFAGLVQAAAESGLLDPAMANLEEWLALRQQAEVLGEAAIELRLGRRWIRITDRPTEDGGIVSIASDVTDSIEREQSLRAARDLAEQASRSKSEFLANMSHELRTPLNAIIGFSEIMRAETLGPIGTARYREYLDDIIDSGRHLLGVINDILDVAKSEAGKLDLNEQTVDVAREVEATLRLFASQAEAAKVVLENLCDDARQLRADQRKVRQILLNLVSNAIKFTPPGGRVVVSIAGDAGKEDGGSESGLAVTVADTGIGIRPEDMPAALAPFGQVESSLSRRYQGTGLGLPLTLALVKRHDGSLTIDSEPGQGTRVTVRFPPDRVIAADRNRTLPRETA